MMRRIGIVWMGLLPLLLTSTAFLVLGYAEAPAADVVASPCETGPRKWAAPVSLYVGDEASVTSVITGTCPAFDLPIDIVLLVDQSNSMTKGWGSPIDRTPSPGDPTRSPSDPTAGPGPGPIFPTPGTGEPPTDEPEPKPTGIAPSRSGRSLRPRGLAQGPGPIPTSTDPPLITPGPSPTFDPEATKTPGGGPGPGDPTRESLIREREEPPGTEDLIREVVQAIRDFLDQIEGDASSGRVRLGLATFNDRGHQLVPLTDDVQRVRSRLSRIRGSGNTRVDLGLSTAYRMLVGVGVRGRTDLDHRKMIILFSDGKYDRRITARLRRRDRLDIFTVAAGRSADRVALRNLASEAQYALTTRDRKELVTLYRRIAPFQRAVTMDMMTIEDRIAPNMVLVPGSVVPVPDRIIDGRTLQWDFVPPASPITVSYKVRPQEVGRHPVSELAHATWTDSERRVGDVPFPEVELNVLVLPTVTPTLTPEPTPIAPTDTPSPTPEPGSLYLPLVLNQSAECKPAQQNVDVAMIVDTSMSMAEPTKPGGKVKLGAAIDAMRQLLQLLKPGDQAAVVEFNRDASVVVRLTSDHAAVSDGLDRLPQLQESGTRIEVGLQTALVELQSVRHIGSSNRAVVIVTDGQQGEIGGRQAVIDAAAAIKAQEIDIYAVGVGQQVDRALIEAIASSRDTVFFAPEAEELELIYRRIAVVIPCPQP